jgi:hypothetical protein
MAKVKIKGKLPEGYSLVNGKVVRSFKEGGATKKTLQPVSREAANLEAEKNETALTDLDNDGSFELYNIGGKRHSEGGTPLNLPEQTFVFSDTRKMLLSKEELKELGIESKKKMTPAKASKKFPLNEYIDVLQDEHSDEIAIRSAEEMLNKNKLKLSQIAFMQESKKDFSDGLPVAAYPFLMSQGIDPQEFEAKIQEQNAPQQGQQGQMSQEQMAMGPQQGNLQQFTGPPQGGPPMGPPQGGMPPMGPPPGPGGPGGEGMPPPEVMQQLMAQQGQGGPPMGRYGGALPRFQLKGGLEFDENGNVVKSEVLDLSDESNKERRNRIKNYTHPYLTNYYEEFSNAGIDNEKYVRDIMSSMNVNSGDTLFVNQGYDANMINTINNMNANAYIGSQMYDDGSGNWEGTIGSGDRSDYYTTEQDEDGNSWDFLTNLYRNTKGTKTGVLKSRKKYGGSVGVCSTCGKKLPCGCKYRNGGALRSFVYGGDLPKAQFGKGCDELQRIRQDLLFELHQAEQEGEGGKMKAEMDVIRGLHRKLQQVDRDMHDCMVKQRKTFDDKYQRRLHEDRRNQTVPLLKPITPTLNPDGSLGNTTEGQQIKIGTDNPYGGAHELSHGSTSEGQSINIECNGPEAERLAMQCQAQGLQFDPLVCDCVQQVGVPQIGSGPMPGMRWQEGMGGPPPPPAPYDVECNGPEAHAKMNECIYKGLRFDPAVCDCVEVPEASSIAVRPRSLFGNIGTRIGNVFRSDEKDIDPTQVMFDPATGQKLSRDQQILLNQGPQPGERMSVGSVYKQGGCTSCQKNLRRFTDGGSPSTETPMGGAPSDMTGWGANYDTPNRMSEEQLMLMQLDNYRRELLKEYQLTQAKVSDPDFVADKETQEQIAFTFQTLEMKLDQVEQKASELQELMIQKNSQIPLFPHLDNTQSMSPQTSPGQGYYRFGGDTLNKFVYGGALPKYAPGGSTKKKTTDLSKAGYSKYLGNDHELGDHDALMKLVDEGVLKRESVSGSFYYANVCSDVNGNPVDGENADDCKANGGHWVPSKRQKSKTSKLDNEQNPISNERVQGRQAGNTAVDILNNPSFAPVLKKISEEYNKNASSVKRGNKTNKDNWVDFDDFGGEQGMMNAFFSVNSYLNEAQQDGLAFCGQLGEDGNEHAQQYEYKPGKFQSVSKCKSIECCKNIDRENQKKLGVSIDDETARMFQGVYYTLDKLKNVDKDPGTMKLFEQLNVNPIGLKRSKGSKHFGADGKSPVSLVDGVIGGTSSGQFFTPTESEDSTIIEDEWNNPCDQAERDAKRKECTAAGKGFDAKTCDCYELPDDPGKTKIPRYETFPRDDRALLNRLEQYNEIEQINPNLIQEDRYAPDPAYLDPRAKLASIEANVQEAIKNDPKNASFLMGKASELADKTINEFENLNNKIYTGANQKAVDARNEEEEVNKSHLKTFYDESAMAKENYNVERQESKDAWVETAGQREENADEMYIRNFENPNFWFSPQEHAINFYNEKGLDPTKHQNIDWNELQRNAPKNADAAKLYWDKVRQTYQINTPNQQKHLNSKTMPENKDEVVKYGKEINRTRRADLMRSRKKLRKWILGIQ